MHSRTSFPSFAGNWEKASHEAPEIPDKGKGAAALWQQSLSFYSRIIEVRSEFLNKLLTAGSGSASWQLPVTLANCNISRQIPDKLTFLLAPALRNSFFRHVHRWHFKVKIAWGQT